MTCSQLGQLGGEIFAAAGGDAIGCARRVGLQVPVVVVERKQLHIDLARRPGSLRRGRRRQHGDRSQRGDEGSQGGEDSSPPSHSVRLKSVADCQTRHVVVPSSLSCRFLAWSLPVRTLTRQVFSNYPIIEQYRAREAKTWVAHRPEETSGRESAAQGPQCRDKGRPEVSTRSFSSTSLRRRGRSRRVSRPATLRERRNWPVPNPAS